MPQNTHEIHKALLESGLDVPENAARFRNFMGEVVRKGIIKPPTRIPIPGGGRGQIGSYDDDTVDRLTRYLRSRSEAARVKSELIETARNATPMKRRLSVSFWVPEDLANKLDVKMKAGHTLTGMLFDGIIWLHDASEEVKELLYTSVIGGGEGVPMNPIGISRQPAGKWHFVAALTLASLGYQRAEEVAADLGFELDDLLRGGVITFHVKDGEVIAYVTTKEGNAYRAAVETEEG